MGAASGEKAAEVKVEAGQEAAKVQAGTPPQPTAVEKHKDNEPAVQLTDEQREALGKKDKPLTEAGLLSALKDAFEGKDEDKKTNKEAGKKPGELADANKEKKDGQSAAADLAKAGEAAGQPATASEEKKGKADLPITVSAEEKIKELEQTEETLETSLRALKQQYEATKDEKIARSYQNLYGQYESVKAAKDYVRKSAEVNNNLTGIIKAMEPDAAKALIPFIEKAIDVLDKRSISTLSAVEQARTYLDTAKQLFSLKDIAGKSAAVPGAPVASAQPTKEKTKELMDFSVDASGSGKNDDLKNLDSAIKRGGYDAEAAMVRALSKAFET